MLRGVTESESSQVRFRFVGLEDFVERAFGMGVQVVHHQCDDLAVGVARVEQVSHFQSPVDFRAVGACRGLSISAKRFGEYENACCAISLVLIVNTLAMLLGRFDWHARFLQ